MSGTDMIDVAARGLHNCLTRRCVDRVVTQDKRGREIRSTQPASPRVIRGIEAAIFDGCTLLVVGVAIKVVASFQTGWISTTIFGFSLLGRVVAGRAVFLGDDMGDVVAQVVNAAGLSATPPGLHPIQISRVTLLWLPERLAQALKL